MNRIKTAALATAVMSILLASSAAHAARVELKPRLECQRILTPGRSVNVLRVSCYLPKGTHRRHNARLTCRNRVTGKAQTVYSGWKYSQHAYAWCGYNHTFVSGGYALQLRNGRYIYR